MHGSEWLWPCETQLGTHAIHASKRGGHTHQMSSAPGPNAELLLEPRFLPP